MRFIAARTSFDLIALVSAHSSLLQAEGRRSDLAMHCVSEDSNDPPLRQLGMGQNTILIFVGSVEKIVCYTCDKAPGSTDEDPARMRGTRRTLADWDASQVQSFSEFSLSQTVRM
jgi:hypothetical protein